MKIESIEVRWMRMPLVHPFETSFGREIEREFLLVALHGDGLEGWGECVAGRAPLYSAETTGTASHVLRDFLIPLYLSSDFERAEEIEAATRSIKGHAMARACLEMAWWDLWSRRRDLPLACTLGGTHDRIRVGVSLGIEPTIEATLESVEAFRLEGYARIKLKIKPGWDTVVVDRVREMYPDLPLMVDPNSAYTLEDAPLFAAMDRHRLMMIEQPLDAEDIIDHAALQRQIATPICLDESIKGPEDARKALDIDACRVINVKPGRVGGHLPSRRIHDLCRARGVPVWCGGMLESGIGRAHNVALASLPGFSLPGDISASARYYAEDLVDPPFTVASDGTMAVPTGPGLGVELRQDLIDRFCVAAESYRA